MLPDFLLAFRPRRNSISTARRPILADKCFHCHGPDKETREGGLRLDVEADAKKEFDGHFALVPGNAEDSEVYYRIMMDDDNDPHAAGQVEAGEMTKEEKEIIRRWIEEGAEYQIVGPRRAEAGRRRVEVSETLISNNIDKFILNRLDERGLGFEKLIAAP